jgi:two-component system response regulator YesN
MYTLVIADDEVIERKAMKLLLTKEFPDIEVVACVGNGADLIAAVEESHPDIALVDVNMPGINGLDAIEILRQHASRTHFVIISAYDDFKYVQKALNLQINAYILKPGRRQDTVDTIRKLCEDIDKSRFSQNSQAQVYSLLEQIQPVLESEIMMSLFIDEPSQENFDIYCTMHGVKFWGGAVVSFVPTEKSFSQQKASLNTLISQAVSGSCSCLYNVTESNICLLLFLPERVHSHPETEHEWLQDLVKILFADVQEKIGAQLRVGVSRVYDSFAEMSTAYHESIEALKQQADFICYYKAPDQAASGAGCETQNEHVQAAMRYIQAHYKEDLSLDQIAEQSGISPFYLSRLIKQELGITLVEYLTQVRVKRACELALSTKQPINEIAVQVGYLNPTYFCRIFKRSTGVTIGQMREQHAGMPEIRTEHSEES